MSNDFEFLNLPIRVLAVDDRERNLIALDAVLKKSGVETISALSGKAALEFLDKYDFAAILLDVQMPIMDGFETARLIRQHPRAKHTPIIFVTAINRDEGHEHKGYISGAVDFLFKPLDPQILSAKVLVFADLYRKNHYIKQQADFIKEQALKEQEYALLKKSIATRDEFLSVAAHELNTPITPLGLQMQSFLKMIDKGTFTNTEPERLKRMLETAYSQVERLARIIRELVDVSRLSAGRLQMNKEEVSLENITQSVLEAFAEEIHRIGCDVQLKVSSDARGLWDKVRVEQIIINLLANALKYGLGKPVTLHIEKKNEIARLQVTDQGIGISPEDQQRIFERFERAVPSTDYGGLGLGLYITKEIVRLHDGAVYVQSQKNHGSTFTVELPSMVS